MTSNLLVAPEVEGPEFTRTCLNLADGSLGAKVLWVTDEFFAPGNVCWTRLRLCFIRTGTTITANGWTAGRPGGAETQGMTGV